MNHKLFIALLLISIGSACSPDRIQTFAAPATSESSKTSTTNEPSSNNITSDETPAVNESATVSSTNDNSDSTTDDSTETASETNSDADQITETTDEDNNSTESDPAEEIDDTVATENPDDGDRFLNNDDAISINYGADGGYGSTWLPDIVFGPPLWTGTHVVSIGAGGTIEIELGGFIIVDGPGADFIVFENVMWGWQEPSQVSVSSDGIHFKRFSCESTNTKDNYPGCAGATEINYSDDDDVLTNPETAGGDSFDLADVGLTEARYIRIKDLSATEASVGEGVGKSGFDLDAVAIVNGINE